MSSSERTGERETGGGGDGPKARFKTLRSPFPGLMVRKEQLLSKRAASLCALVSSPSPLLIPPRELWQERSASRDALLPRRGRLSLPFPLPPAQKHLRLMSLGLRLLLLRDAVGRQFRQLSRPFGFLHFGCRLRS
ncbi:Hypothetical predicted protein [Podarcis lilfordi]|uniref:Uncharacterized protein n=1 Tax=Podarcis lilfordi TaxID=74358 RepID=A0AA35JWR0_9SAUR|nr:Hypothetical predicted protein [Podarcis lilfordi]